MDFSFSVCITSLCNTADCNGDYLGQDSVAKEIFKLHYLISLAHFVKPALVH